MVRRLLSKYKYSQEAIDLVLIQAEAIAEEWGE